MPKNSLITVVVPAYNQGPYIERTIESLLAQTVTPATIIISNNHSTDATGAILERYRDRVEIISPPTFLPAGEHGDFIFSQVKTPWAALLSSDDVAEPNYVAGFAESIAKYPDAVLVHGGVLYIDKDEITAVPRFALKAKEYAPYPDNLTEQFLGPVANFAAFAMRVDAFRKTSGFAPWLGMGEWPVYLQLATHGAFIYRREIMARYRCSYRPNINMSRYTSFLHDEAKIGKELVPAVLRATGQTQLESRHRQASLTRYNDRVVEFYDYGTGVDQQEALKYLTTWGGYLGQPVPVIGEKKPLRVRLWSAKRKLIYEFKRMVRAVYGRVKYRLG